MFEKPPAAAAPDIRWLDSMLGTLSLPAVIRLRPFVAALLLALWLPVTLHCAIEASGVFGVERSCLDDCNTDNCATVEDGFFKSTTPALHVTAPVLTACICCLIATEPETITLPVLAPERTCCPLELVPTWQFAVRAALPARAP